MFKSKAGRELLEKMSWVADLLMLSILWFVFSIPLVTIGAASSGMYRAIQYRLQNGNGNIWHPFWRTFKSSFIQSTILWLGYASLILVFILNQALLVSDLANSWLNHFSQVFLLFLIVGSAPILIMSLSYIARFDNSLKIIWKNTMVLSMAHFKDTMYILIVVIVSIASVYLVPILIVIVPAFSFSRICPRLENIYSLYVKEEHGA